MLTLKNPFSQPQTGPEMPTVNDPGKAVKRWELEQGRTKKRIEDLDSQHAAATEARDQAQHAYGAQVESGEASEISLATLKQAEEHIRACEAALTIAKEKDRAALAALKDAKRQAGIEKEFEALAYLKLTVAPEIEDMIALVARLSAKLASGLEDARLAGAGGPYNSLTNAPQALAIFLGMSMDPLTGTGRVPDRLRPYKIWSDCLPDPETARSRARP